MWTIVYFVDTRETAALGGVSLALQGSAAFGAPSEPIWETAALGDVSAQKKLGWLQCPIWGGFGGGKKVSRGKMSGACGAPNGLQTSEYVLGFQIGQRESGFYSERTDTQRDTAIQYGISI